MNETKKNIWHQTLNKTNILFEKIGISQNQWGDQELDDLEEALLLADTGISTTDRIVSSIRKNGNRKINIKQNVIDEITNIITPLEFDLDKNILFSLNQPTVILFAGVNGAGKTTTIAKLIQFLINHKLSVVVAAADTFRAAAREQLQHWGKEQSVRIISQQTTDPAAVCFDTINSAINQKTDVVIIDTAGRLPTQKNLMAELSRINKVCSKALNGAYHQNWIILDGTNGQNAISQVQEFNKAINLSGIIISKLDGSSKGGFILSLTNIEPQIPIAFIGSGEKPEDLQKFSAQEFACSLIN